METKKSKKIFNIIMVALIVLMIAAGVFAVGSLKGRFKGEEDSFAVIGKATGFVNVERSGVSFEVKKGSELALETGDVIDIQKNSSSELSAGKNTYTPNENSKIKIDGVENNVLSMTLKNGELFAVIDEADTYGCIAAGKWKFYAEPAVFSVNVQTGSMSLNVLKGTVTGKIDGKEVKAEAGQVISVVKDKPEVSKLSISSLNDFNLNLMKDISGEYKLCFTADEIDKVMEERSADIGADAGNVITVDGEEITSEKTTEASKPVEKTTGGKVTEEKTTAKTDSGTTTGKTQHTTEANQYTLSCTIEIRCDTILGNIDNLNPGKDVFVPRSGIILPKTTIQFKEGETVFEVLKRACSAKNIQIEYAYTPGYGSYYIEGINHLYEFDCGDNSGWMYKVNGWFPNYGCSSYKLDDGDSIVWCYTCNGLGEDVGGGGFNGRDG